MATTKTTAPRGAAAPVLDLTPAMADNWTMGQHWPPVLIVNPEASLHQRCALAWVLCCEAQAIAVAAENCGDTRSAADVFAVLIDRTRQLGALLRNLSEATLEEERGQP